MNKKKRMWIYPSVLTVVFLILVSSCEEEFRKKDPVITWSNPADITSGTLLSEKQLNATATALGTFTYTPAAGSKLSIGANQVLKVDFTPIDGEIYNAVSSTVKINVTEKKNPIVTWSNPADITFGTVLSALQLNATADVTGTFVYTPVNGTKLNVGLNQELKVDFTPADAITYNASIITVKINVQEKKNPIITWSNPADIAEGTKLSGTQLNATADVEGTFTYTPGNGAALTVGNTQNLKVDFTPTDAVTYNTATKTVTINVVGLSVGDNYQGGVIAYILQSDDPGYEEGVQHGLIAAPSDQGIVTWYNTGYMITGASNAQIGSGQANTNTIISSQGNTGTYAAKLCQDLVIDTYSDWYLPSIDELTKLYNNRVSIGGFASNGVYWSSTEITGTYAAENVWYVDFKYSGTYGSDKSYLKMVRAIRSF